jgi:hypothetical protein
MSFFHNLNKKLDSIAARPESAQLNERDMGKHNNATTGFKAVADKAAKEYGSKAAGERVAGAQFQKMKKAGQLEEEGMSRAAKGWKKYGDGMTELSRLGREGASEKKMDAARKKYDKYDNTEVDEGLGDMARAAGSAIVDRLTGKPTKAQYAARAARQADNVHGAEGKARRTDYLDQMDSRDKALGYDESMYEAGLPMVKGPNGKMIPKFAADGSGPNDLKKSFADKIAGAKKEVDEMLGDVAAEAMKNALGGGRKVMADEGNDFTGSRLAAIKAGNPTFKVGGKTYRVSGDTSDERAMDEASDDNAFTAHKRARAETPKVGTITHGSKHDVEEIPGGRRVTRRTDAQGISVGADDGQSSSDAPRGRGRPKGPAKAPERVTGGATKHKGGRKMTKEGGGMMKHTFAILDDTLIDQIANMNGAEVDPDAGSVETYDENTARQLIAFAQKNPQRLKRTQTMNTAGMRPMARHSGGSGAGPEYNLKEVGDVDIADQGEYDQEGDMAKDSIKTVVRHAQALEKILGDNDNLPEWVQSKLAKIESMMTAVDDYMQNQETDQDDEMAMGEEKTSTRDNRAERAGKRVAKDIEYDEKKKDGIHGSRRGSEDNKADKAGKKVTKDIEHDEKEDDEKEDKPKKSKSKFKFGGSVYENLDAQLETLINESMNVTVNMATSDDGQGDNTITVTASGEDAMTLAQLLKSAGLSQSSHSGCSVCGQSSCGCEQVDENSPDWPTNTETSDDALQYSGGLNKPKSTGQTTTPVLASQLRRQVSMEESVKIERNLFDLYKSFTK